MMGAVDRPVRPATLDDLPAVAAVYAPYVARTVATFDEDVPDLDTWRAKLAALTAGALPFLVAEVDGRVAGFVALHSLDATTGEIHMVAVDPALQRHGVGRALTEQATTRLRERGSSIAMVETGGDPGHAPARALYEHCGYTPLPSVRYFRTL